MFDARRGEATPTRICLLSRKSTLYSTTRLMEEARRLGHQPSALDPMKCSLAVSDGVPEVVSGKRAVRSVDVVLPRVGASTSTHGIAVLHQFELMGLPVVNPTAGVYRSRDKLRSLQLLARMGVQIPRTYICARPEQAARAVKFVGGPPVILKLQEGTQGVGVMIAESMEAIESILDTMWSLGRNILIQEFVAESKGKDLRAIVVGNEVVACMRRKARMGEFRSNIHRGGIGEPVEVTPEISSVALAAARAMGLNVAGVDMLEASDGLEVIEVNASPGLEGIEGATGLNVARRIVSFTASFAEQALRGREIGAPAVHLG